MSKKINFGKKPTGSDQPIDLDTWVSHRASLIPDPSPDPEPAPTPEKEKIKRLTLDIPESLHRRIKLKATEQGVTMVELLRDLLHNHFTE